MTRIETGKAAFQARYILPTKPNKLVAALETDRLMSEVAAAFEGCENIRAVDEEREGVYTTYEGYTELTSVQRVGGEMRIIMTRSEEE